MSVNLIKSQVRPVQVSIVDKIKYSLRSLLDRTYFAPLASRQANNVSRMYVQKLNFDVDGAGARYVVSCQYQYLPLSGITKCVQQLVMRF